jgi:hypothetical protein
MTEQEEIDELADRLDSLLVSGLSRLRHGRTDDALLLLQEALKTAQRLPKKEPSGEGS